MTNEYTAMIISIFAMIITIVSFQFKSKRLLLFFQSIGSFLYLVSFVFAGSGIAVYLNVIYLIRNFVYMKDKNSRKYGLCTLLCTAYICAFILELYISGISRETLWNILPVAASCLGTVALLFNRPEKIRFWKLGDSVLWLGFNIHIGIGALGGIIGEVMGISSNIISIFRFKEQADT